jgi:hypothetical protein
LRQSLRRDKEISEEKKSFAAFGNTHYEKKMRASPRSRNGSYSSDEYGETKVKMDLIDNRLSDANMRAQYRLLAKREYSLGEQVKFEQVQDKYQKLSKDQEKKQMEIFKGMLDRQKKLEGFFKEKKNISLYNNKEKETKDRAA